MQAIQKINSRVIPLDQDDVDTDMIIPAQFLTSVSREGYGEHVFQRLREQDPHFVFNQAQYLGAEILISKKNFGCGSSREHAVWALQQAGIRVILAESYSDIFYNNAVKNGLLLIRLDGVQIKTLMQHVGNLEVDLEKQTIGAQYFFDYDPFRKACLLKGQDDFDYLLEVMRVKENCCLSR